MRSFCPTFVASLLLCLASVGSAQTNNYVTGGTITGHIYCADTNAPARFARVMLKSTSGATLGDSFLKNLQKNMAKSGDPEATKPMTEQQKRQMAAVTRGLNQAADLMNSSTVALDGSFTLNNVKPGTYYVHAIYAGYIDPVASISDEDFSSDDPAVRARIAQLPTVTIQGTESARIDLRLDRGAAISGRILYPDGTPAPGWLMSVVTPKSPEDPGEAAAAVMKQVMTASSPLPGLKTDDRGNFRISGLTPGDYAIRASLLATPVGVSAANIADGGSGINLAVYSGDTFSRADAKAFHLNTSDEQSGIVINIPANKLHTISGHVLSNADGHAINGGNVTLASKDNAAITGTAAIRDDGSFHFEYLPPGSYTVTVASAEDVRHKPAKPAFMGMNLPNDETLKKYGVAKTDVLLADSDVDNIHLSVAPTKWAPSDEKAAAAPKVNVNLGDLLSGDDDSDDKPATTK